MLRIRPPQNHICEPYWAEKRGIRVQKVIQKKGDFVVSFIGTAHLVINLGINIAEAINLAMEDWFSFGLQLIFYFLQRKDIKIFLRLRFRLLQLFVYKLPRSLSYSYLNQTLHRALQIKGVEPESIEKLLEYSWPHTSIHSRKKRPGKNSGSF